MEIIFYPAYSYHRQVSSKDIIKEKGTKNYDEALKIARSMEFDDDDSGVFVSINGEILPYDSRSKNKKGEPIFHFYDYENLNFNFVMKNITLTELINFHMQNKCRTTIFNNYFTETTEHLTQLSDFVNGIYAYCTPEERENIEIVENALSEVIEKFNNIMYKVETSNLPNGIKNEIIGELNK